MPSPSELVNSLHSTLTATMTHLETIDQAEAKAKAIQTQLDSTLQEYNDVSKSLERARAELADTEKEIASRRHLINDEAARALAATQRQIVAKQEELKTLQLATKQLQEQHDQLIASMQALKSRLNV